jgi:DNA mismatch repair protein MutL
MVEDSGTLPTQVSSLHSQLALSLARHAAIPYGQLLSNAEIENVINQLFSCSNVNYTPDGKAILCILPQTDIEQLLG